MKKKVKLTPKQALKIESARREREQILAKLRLRPDERTHFLRMRLPGGGSCL